MVQLTMSIEDRDAYVAATCQPGTAKCCRYLGVGSAGWQCFKLMELRATIDGRVERGQMRATGDNCGGQTW